MTEEGYNVVYEYTEKAGIRSGCRYRCVYADKAAFMEKYTVPEFRKKQTAIAIGISEEEARKIADGTHSSAFLIKLLGIGEDL